MKNTKFLSDPADRPPGGEITWTTTKDGKNLRTAVWPLDGAKGTVLMFSGRTECIEKYGPPGVEFAKAGYASATLDWRGQGLSDRALDDRMIGHVDDFDEFQKDIDAFMDVVRESDLPEPYFLVAHSMGGAIGLRALLNGLPVKAAAFSGPMWGIPIPAHIAPFAKLLAFFVRTIGMSGNPARPKEHYNYVLVEDFEKNTLTSDRYFWDFMAGIVRGAPDLGLGSMSYGWVAATLDELRDLSVADLPDLPVIVAVGDNETVVEPEAMKSMAARWPSAELITLPGGKHEVMMETKNLRDTFYRSVFALFDANL